MRFVLGIIRVLSLFAVCLVAIAIGLGRWASTLGSHVDVNARKATSRYLEITDSQPDAPWTACRLLDTEKCRSFVFPIPKDDSLFYAVSSPWTDEKGEIEVVGRWTRRVPKPTEDSETGIGLARYRFPSGDPLDYVELNIVPAGNPCWFPGGQHRVLFCGLDGRLYAYDFEKDRGTRTADRKKTACPPALAWRCPEPGLGQVRMSDPRWPTDPRLGGKLIVSLIYIERVDQGLCYAPSEIWWLELNREGTAVVAAGPLTTGGAVGNPRSEKRMPNLFRTPDGGLALAYLNRQVGERHWQMCIARVELEGGDGLGHLRSSAASVVAEELSSNFLAASSDGRWLYAVRAYDETRSEPRRYSAITALSPGGRQHPVTSRSDAGRIPQPGPRAQPPRDLSQPDGIGKRT